MPLTTRGCVPQRHGCGSRISHDIISEPAEASRGVLPRAVRQAQVQVETAVKTCHVKRGCMHAYTFSCRTNCGRNVSRESETAVKTCRANPAILSLILAILGLILPILGLILAILGFILCVCVSRHKQLSHLAWRNARERLNKQNIIYNKP